MIKNFKNCSFLGKTFTVIVGIFAIIGTTYTVRTFYATIGQKIAPVNTYSKSDQAEITQNENKIENTKGKMSHNINSQSGNITVEQKGNIVANTVNIIQPVTPKPLKKRLIKLLETIDQKILSDLKSGKTSFSRHVTLSQLSDLQKISQEPNANKYIAVAEGLAEVSPGTGNYAIMYIGAKGQTQGVNITLSQKLLAD